MSMDACLDTKIMNKSSDVEALLRRQQELVTQLRALVLPALHHADGRLADIAIGLFDGIDDCIASALSRLQSISTAGSVPAVDFGLGDHIPNGAGEGQEEKPVIRIAGQKRRRNNDKRSRSLVSIAPHYDGHHWRKYGQKNINGRQHARSYYRCAFYVERKCSATKTIQQQDHSGTLNCEEETAKYTVVYYGHHTCRHDNTRNDTHNDPNMDLIQSGNMAGAATEFQMTGEKDLNVPALIEVLDNPELDWNMLLHNLY